MFDTESALITSDCALAFFIVKRDATVVCRIGDFVGQNLIAVVLS